MSASSIAIGPILLLVLIGVLAVALLATRRSGLWMAPGRRPRKRHIVTRIICAALGALILGAVAVGTWQDVRRCYEPGEKAEVLTVHVPARPAPSLPAPLAGEFGAEIERARLLVHFMVVDVSSGRFRPLHIEEDEIKWPEDRGRTYGTSFELDAIKVEYGFSIDALRARRAEPGKPPFLEPRGNMHVSHQDRYRRGSRSGGFAKEGVSHWRQLRAARPPSNRPLSIVPGTPPSEIRAFFVVTRVAEDDPLKEVPATEFLESREGAMREAMSKSGGGEIVPRFGRLKRAVSMPGVALAAHIGISSLLLLVAAILLTQLFTRRSLAFAGVLAAVVLYVAVLDRAALAAHLSRLRDPQASVETRLSAATQATTTFFYQETAQAALDEARKAEASSVPLREVMSNE